MPTKSTITLLFVSQRALLPFFAGYLGHCSSSIVLLCMIFHTNYPVSNTQELHLLTSKESIYTCISFIYLSWTFPVSSFSTKYLVDQIKHPSLEESININSVVNYSLKDVSQILMALDIAHWGGSPSSYNWCSSRFYSLAFFWYSKTI
jgi:hypothetical protein